MVGKLLRHISLIPQRCNSFCLQLKSSISALCHATGESHGVLTNRRRCNKHMGAFCEDDEQKRKEREVLESNLSKTR